jgi:hypothetical protein
MLYHLPGMVNDFVWQATNYMQEWHFYNTEEGEVIVCGFTLITSA